MITKYNVSGMTCGHCAAAITEEVSQLEGVTDVNVSLEDASMVVKSDQRVPHDAIIGAVSEAGDYSVVEA